MNPRVALLSVVIAFGGEKGICQTPADDFNSIKNPTPEELSAFYSFDDPNLTQARRRAAADFLHRAATGQAVTDTDETESSHPSLVELVKRAKPAVVQLEVDASNGHHYTGTGFFISRDGYCVTNAHLVSGALKVVAIANDGTQYYATRIAYCDKDADLAIVKFDCRDVTFLVPGDVEAEEGQSIVVIGSPELLTGTVSTGIISAVRRDVIQISAPISHGSSGSPVINEDGRVVGVAVGFRDDGQNLNFAVPLAEIWRGVAAVQETRERKIRSGGN